VPDLPPALSAVTITLNGYAGIRGVVESLRAQTVHHAIELVIVTSARRRHVLSKDAP